MISKEIRLVIRCDDCGIKAHNYGSTSTAQVVRILKSKGWYANQHTHEVVCPTCRKRRVS